MVLDVIRRGAERVRRGVQQAFRARESEPKELPRVWDFYQTWGNNLEVPDDFTPDEPGRVNGFHPQRNKIREGDYLRTPTESGDGFDAPPWFLVRVLDLERVRDPDDMFFAEVEYVEVSPTVLGREMILRWLEDQDNEERMRKLAKAGSFVRGRHPNAHRGRVRELPEDIHDPVRVRS